jgi:hypothetical protein
MFENLKEKSKKEFGSNSVNLSFCERGIGFAEEWFNQKGFSSAEGLTKDDKKECSEYIKAKLYESREEIYKGIITTILIQVIIQLVVKWIIANIFT